MNEGIGTGPASAPVTSTTGTALAQRGPDQPPEPPAEPSSDDFRSARTLPVEEGWYKRAVFYEVLVRAFADSNRDGFGDLRGLTDKLDYLAWLGVDCLWLPPLFDSPLRDRGSATPAYRNGL